MSFYIFVFLCLALNVSGECVRGRTLRKCSLTEEETARCHLRFFKYVAVTYVRLFHTAGKDKGKGKTNPLQA